MNHNFLVRPEHLNQAFESQEPCGCGGHGPGNGLTRRSFIKRTGAVTVATMVAWSAATHQARAEAASGSASASYKICGHKCSWATLVSLTVYRDPNVGCYQVVKCRCINGHILGKFWKAAGENSQATPLPLPAGVTEHVYDYPWAPDGHGKCQHRM